MVMKVPTPVLAPKSRDFQYRTPLFAALASLLLCGCGQPAPGQNAVIGNAIATDEQITGAADDRADHLAELSTELGDEANRAGGAQGRALRRESRADLDEAAQVEENGDAAGAKAGDQIEANAGLLNQQN